MAAEDRPVRPRDRRYAVLSKDSVRVYAESIGVSDLTDEMAEVMAEDVSYRLRDIIQQSYEFMHHAKRKKMTSEDFNMALTNSDVQPIFGHSSSRDPVNFESTDGGEVFFVEDRVVDLASIALSEIRPAKLVPTTVKAGWLAIEGILIGSPPQQLTLGKTTASTKVTPAVSDDLMQYYSVVTKAILGSDTRLMKEALSNLTINTKISPLLGYFINFIANGVKTVSQNCAQLTRLMLTANALVINPSLNLLHKPYLSMLVKSISYCQIEMLTAALNPRSNHWMLRDYAASLLAVLTRRWSTLVNKLREQNLKLLSDVLADTGRPLCTHYGALVGLGALGLDAVHDVLLPVLSVYVQRLDSVLSDRSFAGAAARSDVHHVFSALAMCAIRLLLANSALLVTDLGQQDTDSSAPSTDSSKPRSSTITIDVDKPPEASSSRTSVGFSSSKKQPMLADTYSHLYDCLGDSLAARLPLLSENLFPASGKRPTEPMSVLGVDESAGKTGEELLRQFLLPPTKTSDTEHSSPMSTEGGPTGADMTVKETVSDPSRGIRLTILKRPKMSQESDSRPADPPGLDPSPAKKGSPSKGSAAKRPKTAPGERRKIPISEVFEAETGARRRTPNSDVIFVFRFQGRTQQCIAPATLHMLPRWGVGGRSTVSWYQVLCRRLSHVGPRHRRPASTVVLEPEGPRRRSRIRTCALDLAQTFL